MTLRLLLAAALAAAALAGCGRDPAGPGSGTGTVRVRLTDAPAAYDSVILMIRQVSIHRAGLPEESGWEIVRPDSVAAYDLLQLRNGVFATLGEAPVPAGTYTQVRLLLADGSYVVEDGIAHPLTVPSGLQTGLKLTGTFVVPAGGTVEVGLDFDAARSIHVTGNGRHMLKPTVRVVPIALSGVITGLALPPGAGEWAHAIAGDDTVASAVPEADGRFTLALLPPGVYTVAIEAADAYRDTSLAGVAVTAGGTTDLGAVELEPR